MSIEVLVGHIASGKSSYARRRARSGWIIINDDSIVNAVHADQYTLYSKDLKPLYKSVEDHILHMAVAMGRNVIVDRGLSLSRAARQRWIVLGRSLDVPVSAVLFDIFDPEIHASRRFDADPRGHTYDYWLRVATHHRSIYEPPTPDEGFSAIQRRAWT